MNDNFIKFVDRRSKCPLNSIHSNLAKQSIPASFKTLQSAIRVEPTVSGIICICHSFPARQRTPQYPLRLSSYPLKIE